MWLGKSGKSEGLTRPHSLFTPLQELKSRSPSHFETSILTDSLLYNQGVARELFSVCKREKCPSFQNKYSSILKCFYMYKNKQFFLTTEVNEITAKYWNTLEMYNFEVETIPEITRAHLLVYIVQVS